MLEDGAVCEAGCNSTVILDVTINLTSRILGMTTAEAIELIKSCCNQIFSLDTCNFGGFHSD